MTGNSTKSTRVLTKRELNRATLDRQMLLRRQKLSAEEVIAKLVGMQAQVPNDPYVALWSRIQDFQTTELADLFRNREVVRAGLMRATIHLVTARDGLYLRSVTRSVMDRTFHSGSPYGRNLRDIDVEEVVSAGRALVEEKPRMRAELRLPLAERWPDQDPGSLAYAVTYLLPLVQVTPRGIWGESGSAAWTTMESWLGAKPETNATPDEMILRYLAAFGPASVMDIQAWCGLTKLREVTDRLRPRLRSFKDENGRDLLDIPEGALPDPDTPAPPRFFPEYDNAYLGYADRSRIAPAHPVAESDLPKGPFKGSFLVDGYISGFWRIARERDSATLVIEPFHRLSRSDRAAVVEEATQLLAFVLPDVGTRDVRVAATK